jgi:hypothetical protein
MLEQLLCCTLVDGKGPDAKGRARLCWTLDDDIARRAAAVRLDKSDISVKAGVGQVEAGVGHIEADVVLERGIERCARSCASE